MNLDDPTERDVSAAEYVLGTLRGPDRVAFEAALARDAALQEAVRYWEGRLVRMADTVQPVDPPARLWRRIERSLAAPAISDTGLQDLVRRLRQRLVGWRIAAVLSTATAVALAVFVWDGTPGLGPRPAPPTVLIAVLQAPDARGWLVQAGGAPNQAMITAIRGPRKTPGRDFELWAIPRAGAAPISLGIIGETGTTVLTLPASLQPRLSPGVTLAVSIEPSGGSPTGAPTGPVVFTGSATPLSGP